MAAFVWGKNGEKLTPEDVERQRLASAMMYKQGADFSPAGHWSEALGRAFNGWASGRLNKIAGKAEEAGLAVACMPAPAAVGRHPAHGRLTQLPDPWRRQPKV